MKKIPFLQYPIALAIILSFAASCKKSNFDTPQTVVPTTNAYVYYSPTIDTLNVSASEWTLVDDGSYTCNLTDMAHQHGGWNGNVISVSVIIDGQDWLIKPYPINYDDGKLWSTNVGNVYTLYYETWFGEIPFRSIQLELVIQKSN